MKTIFARTDGSFSEREKRNADIAREIATEGIVVLKNDGVLPVKGNKIALFGSGARGTVKGGTGSGSVNGRYDINIEQGLKNAGYIITTEDWLNRCEKHYEQTHEEWRTEREKEIEGVTDIMQILAKVNQTPFVYPTGVSVTDEDIKKAKTKVAIYVISRQAGEGYDRTPNEGDFLPDKTELANIRKLTENFSDVIVVINAGGQINTTPIEAMGVKGIIFYGQAGQEGGNAFADIVSGKVCPSGKLTVSWVKDYKDIPNSENYGALGNALEQDYVEDIYVGYRYYDTFGVKTAYPFGYGLSYTNFVITVNSVKYENGQIYVIGSVKNTGKCTGKEVVQIYTSMPYGKNGAEAKRLLGFTKTAAIKAGKTEQFEIVIPVERLSRYDEEKSSFVIEEGTYRLLVGNSSVKVNGVCNIKVTDGLTVEQCKNICKLNKQLTLLKAPEREESISLGLPEIVIGNAECKVHGYDEKEQTCSPAVQTLIEKMSVEELASLVIGGGVMEGEIVTALGASGYTTGKLYEKYGIPNLILADGPSGLNISSEFCVDESGNIMALAIPPAYDFGMFGKYMRDNIARSVERGTKHYQYPTVMPCSTILAQTWDEGLCEKFGKAIGDEMQEVGISVWLAPGMNIQKNPLCGRNFEYYSEDPIISGKISAAVIRGVQSVKGKSVSVKHFCCNNVENERSLSSSNLTERALREIYLTGFKIAVEEGKPLTVMSSYNKINGVYASNNRELLVDVLRGEWNFDGLVMTDWNACEAGKADVVKAICAENDAVMPGTEADVQTIVQAVKNGSLSVEQLKKSACRMLELVYKTAAIPFGKKE